MDLNLDNYSVDELLNILQIPPNINITINILQKSLYDKIDKIKNINEEDIPIDKPQLIEFYTKGLFKLVNNIAVINKNISKDQNKLEQTQNQIETQNPDRNDFITKHIDQSVINTFNSNLKSGIINPLVRKSLKQILNINTRYRDNYSATQSTNFSINLPSTIKKVVSMKLINCELPYTIYTISDKLGSNSFIINDTPIIIDNGSYTSDAICIEINKQIIATGISNINISFNPNTGKMTFQSTDHSSFTIDFNYNNTNCTHKSLDMNKHQLTLGWLLGFRGNYRFNSKVKQVNTLNSLYMVTDSTSHFIYQNNIIYTSESQFDIYGNKYFLLSINDYQNNHNNIFISPFTNNSLADINIIAKILTDPHNKSYINYPERIYFGPTNLTKLYIILYDEYGRIIDINNADYSFSLEFEVLYDK